MRFWKYGAMLCKPSQVPNHLLHLRWNRGGSIDGTVANKGLTNGDCSNGILSFLALSPVFSFHLYIKIGLWILTELTEFSTRRLSWMKRERKTIMSWIHLSTRILSSRLIGAWSIKAFLTFFKKQLLIGIVCYNDSTDYSCFAISIT